MSKSGINVYLTKELVDKIYEGGVPRELSMEDRLRFIMGLDAKPVPKPRVKSTRPKNWRYDVSELKIDGSRLFPRDTDPYAMWRSVINYSRKTEKRFTRVVTLQGIQVIRIK